jgi:anti-sigma factor RsiW
MMHCRAFQNDGQFQDELFEYLDGSLAAPAQSEIEAHLEQCAACRQAVQSHQALADRFQRETEFLTLRPGMVNRVLSAAQEPPALRFAAFLWSRWAWPAALAGVLLLAASFSLRWPFRAPVQRSVAARGPAPASISVHVSYCNPTYTFRREKNLVIDALTCVPCVVEEKFSLSMNQKLRPQTQERKTPL